LMRRQASSSLWVENTSSNGGVACLAHRAPTLRLEVLTGAARPLRQT
jgi:hypothetical protein